MARGGGLTDWQRSAIEHYATWGFHGATIASLVKCDLAMVYAAAHVAGIRLRDYRDGQGAGAKVVIRNVPVVMSRRRVG